MNRSLYSKTIIAALTLLSATAQAQHNYGIETSNWSSVNSIYLNPANIADCRERFSINIFSISAGVDNNLGYLSNGGLISSLANGNTTFNFANGGKSSVVAPYAEVRGPGAVISINNKHSIAITTGVRGMNQFSNFDQTLYRIVADPNYVATNNIDLTSQKFNYTAHLWSQLGLSYGGVVYDKGHHEIKVGVTLRYLGGIGYVGLKGNNLDAHFKSGSDSFLAVSNSDIEYASNVLSTKSALLNGFSNQSIISQFFDAKSGSGIGGDIGVTYDYIPGDTRRYYMDGMKGVTDGYKNRYLFRVSASVVDIGGINYNSSENSTAHVSGNGYLTGQGLKDNVKNFNDFSTYVKSKGFAADTGSGATRLQMPTMLLLSVDFHAYKPLYVNVAFAGNLVDRQSFGNSNYNQVTITPRYDTRLLSVGLPISYSALSGSMKLGLGLRASGFFVGSDDMLALFSGHQYGFNFYVGGSVPFYKKKTHDRDGDGVSDRKDHCPDEAGPWSNHGCPTDKEEKEPGASPIGRDDQQE